MHKRKELLTAGIVRDIRFATTEDKENYLEQLQEKKQLYAILETVARPDGTCLIHIVQQYNDSPLIKLYSY